LWPAFNSRSDIGKPIRPIPIQPSACVAAIALSRFVSRAQ
jgi:hypothetical protein